MRLELGEPVEVVQYEDGRPLPESSAVIREALVRLHVNGIELARLMCTPVGLDRLALGFLRSEGIIRGYEDVRRVVLCPSGACVDVWLRDVGWTPPSGRPVLTSGCGGGITFADVTASAAALPEALAEVRVAPGQLGRLMVALLAGERQRGTHASALARSDTLLAVAEDVGRHNTIDRLWGQFLLEGRATSGCILLSTGRISSEMLLKAARMETPVVVSRSSPTSLAVALAKEWGITRVGYARRNSLTVYAGQHRMAVEQEVRHDANS
jgi:FdhD protein